MGRSEAERESERERERGWLAFVKGANTADMGVGRGGSELKGETRAMDDGSRHRFYKGDTSCGWSCRPGLQW